MSLRHFSLTRVRPVAAPIAIVLLTSLLLSAWGSAAFADRYVPKRSGIPGRRESGGTRGACLNTAPTNSAQTKTLQNGPAPQAIALIPEDSGTTVSAYPTMFWSVPATAPTFGEFVLLDDETEVYSSRFQLSGQPGVIAISLPSNSGIPPLQVGKDYRWKFQVVCGNEQFMATEGNIQRVQPSAQLVKKLQTASVSEQATLYAQEGIWYSALENLATLRRAQPKDPVLEKRWQELLESVKLGPIAKDGLVNAQAIALP